MAATAERAPADAFAVVAEADRLAERDLWPGFDAKQVPVAIYDGDRTLLFHHPAPPGGFVRVRGREDAWSFAGRHPAVTANTSAELGGVRTATMMPPAGAGSTTTRAGVLLHEKFHVFQRAHHPGWSANEAELFVYPVEDPELLALRRMESDALRRALSAGDRAKGACWARTALDLRRRRFAALPAGSVAYERGTELNEGLATYVERRATSAPDSSALPSGEFAPEAVRQRAYQTGVALARLLDRVAPAWRDALERTDSTTLDALLSTALDGTASGSSGCSFTPAERERIGAAAGHDIAALGARRAEQRRAFLDQPGWRLVIAASSAPLFPQGFDPLNVQLVASGEVLHTRFLKLGNASAEIEVLGRAALTEAAGDHPLFGGVRMLAVTGFASEPTVTDSIGVLTITADGVHATLRGAKVSRDGLAMTVHLRGAP